MLHLWCSQVWCFSAFSLAAYFVSLLPTISRSFHHLLQGKMTLQPSQLKATGLYFCWNKMCEFFVLSRSQNSYNFISTLPLHLVFAVPLLLHKYSASTGLFQSLYLPFQFTTTLFPIQKVIYSLISSISSFLFPVVAFIAHLDELLFLLYIALLEAQELRGTKPLNLRKLHPIVIILPSGSMGRLAGILPRDVSSPLESRAWSSTRSLTIKDNYPSNLYVRNSKF